VPGIGRLTEPVAKMIVLAEIVYPLTVTAPVLATEPSPSIRPILFFFISPATPPVRGGEIPWCGA